MKKRRDSFVLSNSVKTKILLFYNEEARISPNAKEMILVSGKRTAVKYLEQTLSSLFKKFKEENPNITIGLVTGYDA